MSCKKLLKREDRLLLYILHIHADYLSLTAFPSDFEKKLVVIVLQKFLTFRIFLRFETVRANKTSKHAYISCIMPYSISQKIIERK